MAAYPDSRASSMWNQPFKAYQIRFQITVNKKKIGQRTLKNVWLTQRYPVLALSEKIPQELWLLLPMPSTCLHWYNWRQNICGIEGLFDKDFIAIVVVRKQFSGKMLWGEYFPEVISHPYYRGCYKLQWVFQDNAPNGVVEVFKYLIHRFHHYFLFRKRKRSKLNHKPLAIEHDPLTKSLPVWLLCRFEDTNLSTGAGGEGLCTQELKTALIIDKYIYTRTLSL